LLRLVRWGWTFETLLRIPGAMVMARHVYQWVAARRSRFGCAGDHCTRSVAGGSADDYVSTEGKEE
jgi:hypothetical protein